MEPNQQSYQAKKHITRDTEIKNKLKVSRGDGEGGFQGKEGKGSSKDIYKGYMDKVKGG